MMENKRQGMDNFFRKRISDFEFSENRSNWELLNHLLNEQERKKKRRRWILFFLFFIVVVSAGLFVLLPDKKLNQTTGHKTKPSTEAEATENSSFKNEKNKAAATVSPDKNEPITDAHDAQQKKLDLNSSIHEEQNTLHNSEMGSKVHHTSVVRNSDNEHAAIVKGEINADVPPSNIFLHDSDEIFSGEIKNPESLVVAYPNEIDSGSANTSTEDITNQNSISPNSTIKPTNDSLAALTNNKPPADSATTKELIPDNTRFLSLDFYAGLNVYNTSSAFSNHQHISPLIGVELLHPLTPKFTIGLAGLYSLQGGYNLNDTLKGESYFLDKNVWQQSIQIHQLHKLYFPLTLYYTVARKHSVLCAFQVSYLVNTNGHYSEINTISGVTTESEKNNAKGYMDGIKPTNISASLGYKFSLSKRFDLSTRLTHDLTDSYVKEFFYGVETKPSWSLQAFLMVKF